MKKILLTILICLWAGSAWGADWYINPDGTDNGTCGADGAECQSLEYVIEDRGVSDGDVIYLEAGAGSNYRVKYFKAGTNNYIHHAEINLTITADASSYGLIDMSPPAGAHAYPMRINGVVEWKGIKFLNSDNLACCTVYVHTDVVQAQTFTECYFGDASNSTLMVYSGAAITKDTTLNFIRCEAFLEDVSSLFVFYGTTAGADTSVTLESCKIVATGTVRPVGYLSAGALLDDFTMINCTVVIPHDTMINFIDDGFVTENVKMVNNVFYQLTTSSGYAPIYTEKWPIDGTWEVHHNIFWFPDQHLDASSYAIGRLAYSFDNKLVELDKRNWWLDPAFDGNYNLGSTSKANLKGDSSELPAMDLNGNAWSGGHIGAMENTGPAWTMTPQSGKIVIVGDSIAQGIGARGQVAGVLTTLFGTAPFEIVGAYYNYGSDNIDENVSLGGRGIKEVFSLIDRAAEQQQPEFVVFCYGHNNILGDGTAVSPSAMTSATFASYAKIIADKANDWGMRVLWLGMSPAKEGDHLTHHNTWNDAVDVLFDAAGYLYDSLQDRIAFNNEYTEGSDEQGYYIACGGGGADCLAANVHPAAIGHELALSVIENQYNNRSFYQVSEAGTPIIVGTEAPGTYYHPFSISDINAVTIVPGISGRVVESVGSISSDFNTNVAGGATTNYELRGSFSTIILDQQYWNLTWFISNGSAGIGVHVNATNCNLYSGVVYNTTGVGVEVDQNCNIINVIFETIGSGTGVNNDGGIATQTTNWLDNAADPLFVDTASGNFKLTGASPCINAGTNWPSGGGVDVYDLDSKQVWDGAGNVALGAWLDGAEMGAYGYQSGVAGWGSTPWSQKRWGTTPWGVSSRAK